jgi:FtsH-binding integral membrane protein
MNDPMRDMMGKRDVNEFRASSMSQDAIAAEQQRFMVRVYSWMTGGLGITGFMAFYVANNQTMQQIIFGNMIVFYGLIIAELGLVFYLASRVHKMSASQAKGIFVLYAGLTGMTLSAVLLMYTAASITSTFFVTAGTFGAMSFYGYTTKKDLTSWGSFLFMGLIGIIIASLVNIFLQSPMVYWVVTYAGVLIFVGLTAYDTQKIKEMNILGNEGTDEDTKEAISGALTLYLDFINLFLMLLRIMGDRR